jgi:hypothetical protein
MTISTPVSNKNPIPWLVDRMLEFDPTLFEIKVKDFPELTPQQWLALRIKWGIDLGFVFFTFDESGEPLTAVCLRPISHDILAAIQYDYGGTIWEYDWAGEILFFDFRFGKGTFPLCWDLARASGKPQIAWYYRQRLRLYRMEDIPRITGWQI